MEDFMAEASVDIMRDFGDSMGASVAMMDSTEASMAMMGDSLLPRSSDSDLDFLPVTG